MAHVSQEFTLCTVCSIRRFPGFFQFLSSMFALGNVHECYHRRDKFAIFPDRGTGIINKEVCPILTPKHFIIYMMDGSFGKSRKHGTIFFRMRAAIRTGMMDAFMNRLAYQFIGRVTEHFGCCRIEEGYPSIQIRTKNTFTC